MTKVNNLNVKFIAETSSNHARNQNRALAFVDKSVMVGCDAVKFQLFRIDDLFSAEALVSKPELLKRKNWELPLEFLPALAERCRENDIQFSCTPFYLKAVEELEHYVDFFKISSYELLWDDLLAACASTGIPVILSTGMATMDETIHAVRVLSDNGCHEPTLLHCTSSYPTLPQEANLAAIETLRKHTGCKVGWSDHTVRPGVIHRAIHRWGAEVIEFHLDLDRKGEEYEVGHCWLPYQIKSVIDEVREGFIADGSVVKEPVASELEERLWRASSEDGLRPIKEIRSKI